MPWRFAAIVAVVPLLVTGCSTAVSGEFAAEKQVVADFFELLESGETGGITALLADDPSLTPEVLDSDFYASAIARPADATVGEGFEFEPGLIYVPVTYSLDGEERDIRVAVEQSDGESRITGWLSETLSIDPLRGPGGFQVGGSLLVGALDESTQFVALPGLYRFEYVDPQGLGTVDPDGAETTAFEVEFPIDIDRLGADLPAGVTSLGSGIEAQPTLLADVADDVDEQLEALIDACSASGLIGDSCPPTLVSKVEGVVDTNTILWTDTSDENVSPEAAWVLNADYSVAFNSTDATGRVSRSTVKTTYTATITPDAAGRPTLDR